MTETFDAQIDGLVSRAICAIWPPERWADLSIVIGCSGGADSIALARILIAMRPQGSTLHLAHINHRLRGDAADGDERFVREFAAQWSLPFHCRRLDTGSRRDEASLRQARRRALIDITGSVGARYLALGHHADDQAETVLHRLCRGTGLLGAGGMSPFQTVGEQLVVVRPLLTVWRSEILAYLAAHHQTWREDASNAGDDYARNRIRHRLLPQLSRLIHPQAAKHLCQFAELARATVDEQLRQIDAVPGLVIESNGSKIVFDRRGLATLQSTTRQLAIQSIMSQHGWPLRKWSIDHWRTICAAADWPDESYRQVATWSFPGPVICEIDPGFVLLKRAKPQHPLP